MIDMDMTIEQCETHRKALAEQGWFVPDYLVTGLQLQAMLDTLLTKQQRKQVDEVFRRRYIALLVNAEQAIDSAPLMEQPPDMSMNGQQVQGYPEL